MVVELAIDLPYRDFPINGGILAAYPSSAKPTPHRLRPIERARNLRYVRDGCLRCVRYAGSTGWRPFPLRSLRCTIALDVRGETLIAIDHPVVVWYQAGPRTIACRLRLNAPASISFAAPPIERPGVKPIPTVTAMN